MEYNKDTFCYNPFSHISPQQTGNMRQCCLGRDLLENGKPILYDIDKAFNSEHMNRIRSDLLNGIRAPECNYCWNVEKSGGRSMRLGTLKKDWSNSVDIKNPSIRYLDIRFSNKCNLKCLSCNPEKSDQIGMEEKIENPTLSYPLYDSLMNFPCSSLIEINLLGGEPLLHKETYMFMDYLIESGISDNIAVRISTNCTIYKQEFLDKAKKFKSLELGLSVDGYGHRNEYIRFPSRWESTERNMKLYLDNIPSNTTIHVQQVCSNLAMHGVHDFYNWFQSLDVPRKEIYYIWLQHPSFMKCNIMPERFKARLITQLSDINIPQLRSMLSRIKQPYTEEEKTEFIEYIKKKDKLRGVNILDYCPEFEEWF